MSLVTLSHFRQARSIRRGATCDTAFFISRYWYLKYTVRWDIGYIGRVYAKMVAPKQDTVVPRDHTDVAIVGGGVVGVIAAKRMQERGIDFRVIERQRDFGGVWHTHGNNHSTLQVRMQSRWLTVQ